MPRIVKCSSFYNALQTALFIDCMTYHTEGKNCEGKEKRKKNNEENRKTKEEMKKRNQNIDKLRNSKKSNKGKIDMEKQKKKKIKKSKNNLYL